MFTVASKIPVLGTLLKVVDVGGKLLTIALDWDSKGAVASTNKLVSVVSKLIYDSVLEKTCDYNVANAVVEELYPEISDWALNEMTFNRDTIVDMIKTLGDALISGVEAKLKQADKKIETSMEAIRERLERTRPGGMAMYEDLIDEDFFEISFSKLDIVSLVFSVVMDNVSYFVGRQNVDPFGDFDQALKTYQEALNKTSFSGEVKNGFYGVINNIYEAYFE